MIFFPEGEEIETIKVASKALPHILFSDIDVSAIDIVGGSSSSVIVKRPESSERVEFVGVERISVAVSFVSSRVSASAAMVIVLDVSPAAKKRVPAFAV